MALAHVLYDEAEDKFAPVEMAQLVLASARRVRAYLLNSEPDTPQDSPQREREISGQYETFLNGHSVGMILI